VSTAFLATLDEDDRRRLVEGGWGNNPQLMQRFKRWKHAWMAWKKIKRAFHNSPAGEAFMQFKRDKWAARDSRREEAARAANGN